MPSATVCSIHSLWDTPRVLTWLESRFPGSSMVRIPWDARGQAALTHQEAVIVSLLQAQGIMGAPGLRIPHLSSECP